MKNNLGVDPEEWFENPLDSMPVAKESPSWEDTAPSEFEPKDDYEPSEFADLDWFRTEPEPKKEETMHEKMYRIATARYNPFSLGGSENCDSDISCNIGGSENIQSNT